MVKLLKMTSIFRATIPRHCFSASKQSRSLSTQFTPSIPTRMTRGSCGRYFALDPFNNSVHVAAFHKSCSKPILPPLPQVINGTVNDAASVPPPEPSHGSYHWTFERLISAGLVPLTIVPFAAGSLNPVMDAILCGTILIHSHIGFEAVITDYLPQKRVPTLRLASWWALRVATVAFGVGLYEFETNDVGVTEAISRIWRA